MPSMLRAATPCSTTHRALLRSARGEGDDEFASEPRPARWNDARSCAGAAGRGSLAQGMSSWRGAGEHGGQRAPDAGMGRDERVELGPQARTGDCRAWR